MVEQLFVLVFNFFSIYCLSGSDFTDIFLGKHVPLFQQVNLSC